MIALMSGFRLHLAWPRVAVAIIIATAVGACGRTGPRADEPAPATYPLPFGLPWQPTPERTTLCAATDLSLIACYDFEGDATDGSSYGRDATAAGVGFAPGPFGMHAELDSGSSISVPDDAVFSASVLTFELWLNAAVLPSSPSVLFDKPPQYSIELTPVLGHVGVRCSGDSAESPGGVTATEWTHVAVVLGGGSIEVFVGGVSVATDGGCNVDPGSAALHIGEAEDGGEQLSGAIDRVRIWQRARSAEEICLEAGCPAVQ